MTAFLLFLTGILAGSFGALLGLGGGIIVIPVLTVLFDMPIHTAIGISLVGVIATSTGAAVVNVREAKADIRLGMVLELATTVGAVLGAVTAGLMSERTLYILFAILLAYNTYSMYQKNRGRETAAAYDTAGGRDEVIDGHEFRIRNYPLGLLFSGIAGVLSGLLGVGGGLIKVPVMYLLMGVPLKVAAATSSFMIGITAAASASVFLLNGRIDIAVAVPVALGVFAGAMAGSWAQTRISTKNLTYVFMVVLIITAGQMFIRGWQV